MKKTLAIFFFLASSVLDARDRGGVFLLGLR